MKIQPVNHGVVTFSVADKCISVMPEGIPGSRNRFLELSSTETTFVASSSVLIAGQQRQVSKIMLYKLSWIKDNYLSPLERFTSEIKFCSEVTHRNFSKLAFVVQKISWVSFVKILLRWRWFERSKLANSLLMYYMGWQAKRCQWQGDTLQQGEN